MSHITYLIHVSYLRLLKLLRLHRLKRMIKALYRKFPSMELVITGLELLVTMTLVAHWFACVWYLVGYPDGWVRNEGIVTDDDPPRHVENQEYYEWISSFYWAITTMSTIGYVSVVSFRESCLISCSHSMSHVSFLIQ